MLNTAPSLLPKGWFVFQCDNSVFLLVVVLWLRIVSVLDSRLRGPVQVLAGVNELCSWARHLTLTVQLSTHECTCRWVPANYQGNLTKCWGGGVTCE